MDCKGLPHPSFHGDTRDLVNRFIRKPREIGLGFRNRSSHCHNQIESNDYLSGALGGHEGRSEDHALPKHRRAGRELVALDVELADRKGKMFTNSMTAVRFEGGQEPEGIAITTKTRDQIQTQVEEAISAAAAPEERTGDKVRSLTAGRPSRRARLQSRRDPGR
ncbi:hypothetical protein N7541_011003 [Penicillium brevicompactum]|uniref:Uncharacterized protein n=1 Tax=Penicillium brevicompactum TaxID=5074 RepID=A0A9W9QSK4_PENBR|nr:hypothetical protein N7541_011003 [Penicillium brevicompactum]